MLFTMNSIRLSSRSLLCALLNIWFVELGGLGGFGGGGFGTWLCFTRLCDEIARLGLCGQVLLLVPEAPQHEQVGNFGINLATVLVAGGMVFKQDNICIIFNNGNFRYQNYL